MRKHLTEPKKKFENEATRSDTLARYDLIPPQGYHKTALRFGLGAVKHGDENWKGGGVKFIRATIGHLQWHISKLILGHDISDDHLGAIGWAQAALAWFEDNKPKEYKRALEMMRKA